MELSSQEHRQSRTNLAHRYLSKFTSCNILSLQIVRRTFFWSCWCWGKVSIASRSAAEIDIYRVNK